MFIDSHCHLDYEPIRDDLPGTLARAKNAGVDAMLTICTKLSAFPAIEKIANENANVFCSIGIHPHNAATEDFGDESDWLKRIDANSKIIGIGEAGLDYFYDYAPRDVQADSFRKHISVSRKTGLPIIIHTRDADDDTAQILEEEYAKGAFPILLHCFTGGKKLAERGLAIGAYISFSGILTYKTAEDLRAIAKDVPLDRVLIETDAPYLAPVPHRGKKNEPSFVVHTAQQLADVKNLRIEEIGTATSRNFKTLFKRASIA